MAYMRGHFYIYSDFYGIHIHHGSHPGPRGEYVDCGTSPTSQYVWLPNEIAEDFACMYWHRLDEETKQAVIARVSEEYEGNFGADGVQELLGKQTVMDSVVDELKKKSIELKERK